MTSEPETTERPRGGADPRRIRVAVIAGLAAVAVLIAILAATGAFSEDEPETIPVNLSCTQWTSQVSLPFGAALSVTYADESNETLVACIAESPGGGLVKLDVYGISVIDLARANQEGAVTADCEHAAVPVRDFPEGARGCVARDDTMVGETSEGWSIHYSRIFDGNTVVSLQISTPGPDTIDMDALAAAQGTSVEDLLLAEAAENAILAFDQAR